MKKYLLAGGLSTMLLLGACGGDEPDQQEAEADTEETTEEQTEEPTEEGQANSEESNENDERVQALEDENEQLKEQVTTLEEELETAQESSETSESENTETSDNNSEQSSTSQNLKTAEQGETLELENVNMTVEAAEVNRAVANENDEMMITQQDVAAGDETDVIVIQYTVENTSEAPRNFFLDQAEIVTSNGHQLKSEMMMAEGLNSEMQGEVSNTGTVPYILPDSSGEEIEWVDVIVPQVSDNELNFYTEEQKYRIEF